MEKLKCKICSGESTVIFNAVVLKKYKVNYFQCNQCGFVQTEQPYWLSEAYESSINISDTGIVLRNQRLSHITTSLIVLFFDRKEKFVDYAGGYGLFTRMMRDTGFDFYWSDPYTKNELARGFEMANGQKYHLATSFESFEHFENPIEELGKILKITNNIIISTELLPKPIPKVLDWWYYAPEHGQHIAFYTRKAFLLLAHRFNLNYCSVDNIHLLTSKRIPLLGRWLFRFKFSKHLLYISSYFLTLFLKSKTFEDRERLLF